MVLAPVAIALIWLGGYWTIGLALGAFAIGAVEIVGMLDRGGPRRRRVWPVLLLAIWALVAGGVELGQYWPIALSATALLLMAAIVWELLLARPPDQLAGLGVVALAAAYLGPPMLCGLLIAAAPDGRVLLLLVVASVFAFDSCAFAVGRSVGRNTLAPSISPGKTWEGLLGGLAGALVAGGLFALWIELPALVLAMIGGAVGLLGQIGDLAESALKRSVGAKDSGFLIPGHGGLLDRIDSFTLAFPVAAVLFLASGRL